MRVLMLGPLVVERDGRPVDLGGPRQRSVLAVLLLAHGRPVSVDRLIDAVYDGDLPPSAVGSMQAYISTLRRAIEPDRAPREPARILVSAASGYALRVPDDEVDAWTFLALADQGRQALRQRRFDSARKVLAEALALWRGDLFADLNGAALPGPDRVRFEEARIGAVTDAAEADMGLGEAEAAVDRLRSTAYSNPLRERVWELLALALYRCGQQAEALAACSRLRRTLRAELGIDPGPAMARLETAILQQDPALDGPAAIPASPAPPTVEPDRSEPPEREPFVGRIAAMRELSRAFASALTGTPASVLVVGPAGAGKSRLIEEFARLESARMATVAWGRGTEGPHRISLRAWRQVLESLDGSGAAASTATAAEKRPEVAPDQSAAILVMAEHVLTVVRAASFARPLVVVLEDLHWLDDPSLQVARIVLGELTSARVLIVATVRDDDGSGSPALVGTLAEMARSGVRRIELPPLAPAEVEAYVDRVVGADAGPETAARVFARTGGHPFFVVELVRLLLGADGAHALSADSTEVPGGVRDVVRARLARLPGATRTLLAAAAVLGEHATLDLLEATTGLAPEGMIDAVEPALVTRIVEFIASDALLVFTHSLVRQSVADEVTSLRRARLLAAAVDAAEADGWAKDPRRATALADLALSASAAGGFSSARAVALARSAIGPLAASGSFVEAAALLRRGVELLADAPWQQRHELLVELGRHQQRAGDVQGWIESVEASLELAVAHGDWEAGGRSLGTFLEGGTPWSWLSYGRVRSRPIELLTQLVALVPPEPAEATRVKCLATAVLAAELYFTRDRERCLRLSEQALDLARVVGDSALFAAVVALSEMAVWAGDDPRQRIALRGEALARGLSPAQEAATLFRNAVDLYQVVEVEAAEEALRRCDQLISAHRTLGWEVAFGHLRASRLVAIGDLEAAEQLAARTRAAHRRTTMGTGDAIFAGLLLSIRLEQGRLVDARPVLERALADTGLQNLRDAMAFLLAHTGRHSEAEAMLADVQPTTELPDDGLLTGRLAFRAFAWFDLARAGRPIPLQEARTIGDRMRPSLGQLVMHGGGIGVWGAVDLFLGMASVVSGDLDAAIGALHSAVEVNDAAHNVAWGARSRRLLARTIRARAHPGESGARLADRLSRDADATLSVAGLPAAAGAI